jgi:single-strand DNA-binding protein
MGRLTKDPEIRYYQNNSRVARYCIAVDRKYKELDGKRETDFFYITSLKGTAEFVENYCKKGTKVIVEGEMRNDNYEKDGQKVRRDSYIGLSVEFAESKNSQGSTGSNGGFDGGSNFTPSSDAGDGFMNIPDGIDEELPFN